MSFYKKLLVLPVLLWLLSTTLATNVDDQLIDKIEEQETESLNLAQENLEFTQFNSCDDMETVLSGVIEKLKENRPQYRYFGGIEVEEAMMDTAAPMMMEKSVANTASDDGAVWSSSNQFSTTNNQKLWVDEPEIIKTDGKHIYYYNQQEQKIYIINSPLDVEVSTININDVNVQTIINLPKRFYNTQLFVSTDRLAILGTRHIDIPYARDAQPILNRNSRTMIAVYDTSNIDNLELLKFNDIDWSYTNSRMTDNKLYVISQMWVNRWGYVPYRTFQESKNLPRAVEYSNKKLKTINNKCNDISYILPSEDTMEHLNMHPQFTIISVVDIQNTDEEIEMNILLSQAGEIHMTQDSLYIAQSIWFPHRWECPIDAMCITPWFDNGSQTLVHKFELDKFDLDYQATNIVPGSLLNQYSMDEDRKGNFRILTQVWDDEVSTNFYTLDDDLELKGKIEEIEPGEQFKSSRYIWDKLYLVTFEQIDPLFVIDIDDISNPEIIWELKIPWYSTYLHPWAEEDDGVQYLIWLWYNTDENQRWGTTNGWLQISLYEVDYNRNETVDSKCWTLIDDEKLYEKCKEEVNTDNIRVSRVDNLVLWEKGSWSEALENPRMFVMDSNKDMTLPMILSKEIKEGERCNSYHDENGNVTKESCWPITKQKSTFAGLKTFNIDPNKGINEIFSKDYSDIFMKTKKQYNEEETLYPRSLRQNHMRVGFAGDALYMLSNDFADFLVPDTDHQKYINFDEKLQ